MSIANIKPVMPEQAIDIILTLAKLPPPNRPSIMLLGEPGSGKSSIVRHCSRVLFEKEPIPVHASMMEGSDVKGLPDLDRYNNKIVWRKPDFLPRNGKGALFFDDLTSARRDVLAALYPVFLDRRVDDLEIPPEYMIFAAGNAVDDGAIANDLGTALNDRLLHILVQQTAQSFLAHWEIRDMHPAILTLVRLFPHLLSDNERRIRENMIAAPTSRSWERASNVLKIMLEEKGSQEEVLIEAATSGSVGVEAAQHLIVIVRDMSESLSPRLLMRMSASNDREKIRAGLPRTMRGAIGLAYTLGQIAATQAEITQAMAIMTLYDDERLNLAGAEGAQDMSGHNVAALGIELLMRKARAANLNMTEALARDSGPGQREILEYLERAGKRRAHA